MSNYIPDSQYVPDGKWGPIYIAGPMTGYVDHNFPAFYAMERELCELGWEVMSPAKINESYGPDYDPKYRHEWMLNDIQALLFCTHIMLLKGWEHSPGARLEVQIADACGIIRRNGY